GFFQFRLGVHGTLRSRRAGILFGCRDLLAEDAPRTRPRRPRLSVTASFTEPGFAPSYGISAPQIGRGTHPASVSRRALPDLRFIRGSIGGFPFVRLLRSRSLARQ